MKIAVKIINHTKGSSYDWYKDKLEEIFELHFIDGATGDYVVNFNNSKGDLGSVKAEDCKLFEVEDDVIIREYEHIPTETELLKDDLKNKDIEILGLKVSMAELYEEKDSQILNLKLAIAELVEGSGVE